MSDRTAFKALSLTTAPKSLSTVDDSIKEQSHFSQIQHLVQQYSLQNSPNSLCSFPNSFSSFPWSRELFNILFFLLRVSSLFLLLFFTVYSFPHHLPNSIFPAICPRYFFISLLSFSLIYTALIFYHVRFIQVPPSILPACLLCSLPYMYIPSIFTPLCFNILTFLGSIQAISCPLGPPFRGCGMRQDSRFC